MKSNMRPFILGIVMLLWVPSVFRFSCLSLVFLSFFFCTQAQAVVVSEEVFKASGPTCSTSMDIKIGVKKDGTITAGSAHIRYQDGAFPFIWGQLGAMTAFACYDLKSGKELNRSRIPHRSYGFSASAVATNGKIFLSGEDGLVFEMKAEDEPVLIAVHEMGEPLMASPALSEGVMYLRGQRHLFAVGKHK